MQPPKLAFPCLGKRRSLSQFFKKGARDDPACYRPISLLDSAAKILGKVVLACLTEWLDGADVVSDLQYGFRQGKGTIGQCLNLHLVIGKYTVARRGDLHLAFMVLTSAFDLVSRSKLWRILQDIGLEVELISFLAAIHENTTAAVRYNEGGSLTDPWAVKRGVRQGCILAPLLFTLYINKLGDALTSSCKDIPRAGSKMIPALLYADDAVLVARTARGLQTLLNCFIDFMESLDLITNFKKSHAMTIGSKSASKVKFFCRGMELIKVSAFPYLGVLFDDRRSWLCQRAHKKNVLARASGASLDFAKRIGSKPIPALLKIYNAKCFPMAKYGSEIWGYTDVKELQVAENSFMRKVLSVPVSTPSFNIYEELVAGFISDQIAVTPLLCWLRIWAQPAPNLNRLIIQDCL